MRTINTFDQLCTAREAGLPDVAICPHYWKGTHERYRGGWNVYRPGFNLNPTQKNRWSDEYGVKIFGATAGKDERPALLQEAMEWASKRYGVKEWKRNKDGSYVDAEVQKRFPIKRE